MNHKYKPGAKVSFYIGINGNILEGTIKKCHIPVYNGYIKDSTNRLAYQIQTDNGVWYGCWAHRVRGFVDG